MLIGIYIKDMFLGTPEQFDDTFGGGIEWDLVGDNPCDVEMISTWTRPASPDHTDILIQEFPTEDARDEWFRRTNEQIDADQPGQDKSTFPFDVATYDLIRSKIKDLSWFKDDASWSHETWTAYGVEEHRLTMDPATKTIEYWAEGEGPVYTDMNVAKAAVNEHHKDTVMREFFQLTAG